MFATSQLLRRLFQRPSSSFTRRRKPAGRRSRGFRQHPGFHQNLGFGQHLERLEERLALAVTVEGVKWLDSNYNGIRDNDLIQGDSPDVVFVVDVSTSTWTRFGGDPVGDVNGDTLSNNILDASLAGFIALNNQLKNAGVGDRARVAVVAFAKTGEILDMDPSQPGVQSTARPNDDRDNNGTSDIEQVLKSIKVGLDGAGAIDGGSTNYEAALKKATEVFDDLKTPSGVGNLVFLSDGRPNEPSEAAANYADEAKALRDRGYNLRAFGADGAGVELAPLQVIDPVVGGAKPRPGAAIFKSTNELVGAFAGLRGDSTRYLEPGLAGVTIYIDIDNDGTLDKDEPRAISRSDDPATVGVDETGWYSISTDIVPPGGKITVREIVPSGYLNTSLATLVIPNPQIAGGTIRNEANGSWILDISGGQSWQNIDFGNAPGAISGLKWLDSNRNGIRDSSLIVGTDPDVVFVIDVSGSTSKPFGGTIPSNYVPSGNTAGDVNGDGNANTILDAEIAGFMALNQQLIDQGFGTRGRVSIVSFDNTAVSADLDPTAGDQSRLVTNPTADLNNNGIRDIEEILRGLRDGGSTNYEAALTKADDVFATLGTPAGQGNLIFLSDGEPDVRAGHTDEVAKLKARGVNLRAFGAGDGASLTELQIIDAKASIFRTTGELLAAFGNPQGGTPSTTTFSEPGMAGVTIYVDLNNNKTKDAGEPSAVTAADNPATPNVDERGSYTISGLNAGDYIVREVVPAGYIQTGGGNGRIVNGRMVRDGSWTITIGDGQNARATGVDFGNAAAGVISGVKWRDDIPNGIRDGGLVVGDSPEVMFVIDVSGSTTEPFVGSPVGDINNDGKSDTILDAELAGFIALNKQLITQYGSNARVGITVFATESLQLSISGNPNYSPVYWVAPNAGMASDNVSDVEDCLRGISVNKNFPVPPTGVDSKNIGLDTNYEAGLQTAVGGLSAPRGQSNVIFLSDGIPGSEKYDDEVATLVARGVNVRAFGAGDGAKLPPLQVIDPKATIFRNTDELLAAFGTLQGGAAGSGSFSEPGMAGVTIYLDLDNDGVKDANEPSTVTAADNPATKDIDEAGSYTFTGLAAGKYIVREVVPTGYVLRSTGTLGKFTYETPDLETSINGGTTEPTNNTNNNNDGSWTVYIGWNAVTWTEWYYDSPNSLQEDYIGHAYQTEATGIDFGNAPPANIRGLKWFDRNGDGIRQDVGYNGYNIPSVIFAVDVSGSTWNTYAGCYAGDVNGDGKSNTILDAQLAAILDIQNEMVESGVGDTAKISIIVYGSTACLLDFDSSRTVSRETVTPLDDRDHNGISDLVTAVRSIREGFAGSVNDDGTSVEVGVGTNYEAALQAVLSLSPRGRQLVFLSDGKPTEGGSLTDELASLDTLNVVRRAFGVGTGASLTVLQQIDQNASVYAKCEDLNTAIQSYEVGMLPEPGLSRVTVFVDANNNGVLDAGEKSAVTRDDDPNTIVDETGTYTISDLTAGTYTVREVVPEGYIQTFPVANGGAHSVTITTADLVKNIDFGNKADPLSPVVALPKSSVDLVCYEPNFEIEALDWSASVDDTSSETFAGGNLKVSVWSGDASTLAFSLRADSSGYWQVRTDGNKVFYHDVVIGTFSGGTAGQPLVIALTARATPQSTQELLQSIRITGTGQGTYGTRTIKVTVTDDTGHTSIARYRDVSVVPATTPGAIRNLSAKPANGKALLSWGVPEDDGGTQITNYQIRLQEKIGNTLTSPTLVTPAELAGENATVAGLTNGKSYVFSVRAENAKGFGPWVTLSPAVTPAPTVPGVVDVAVVDGMLVGYSPIQAKPGNRQVTLMWSKPGDDGGAAITNYEIQYLVLTGIKWSEPVLVTRAASTATTTTITGLTNAKPHAFRVRAVNANGAGEWSPTVARATPTAAAGAGERDFNGDGVADVVWRDATTGKHRVHLLNASGQFTASRELGGDLGLSIAATGDFNGDGVADIVWRNAAGSHTLHLMAANGSRLADKPLGLSGFRLEATGDYNGDGKTDLVWRNTTTGLHGIWLMNGATTLAAANLPSVPATLRLASTSGSYDANGDGKTDLVWRSIADGSATLWRMNGTSVASVASLAKASAFALVGAGDFDGDGRGDLLWRSNTTGATSMWLMNDTAVKSAKAIGGDKTLSVAATGDFNGDGKTDLVWRNSGTGVNTQWLMNGASWTSNRSLGGDARVLAMVPAPGLPVVSSAPVQARESDFNGDGISDLMWRNSATGSNAIHFLNSSGEVTVGPGIGGDLNLSLAVTGDFNGDGVSDRIWRNTSGVHTIHLMKADGTRLADKSLGLSGFTIAASGDYNGDGKTDLVWRNSTTGAHSVWLMNGLAPSSTGMLQIPAGWSVLNGLGRYDANGDGKADILLRRAADGATVLWRMNGTSVATTASLSGAMAFTIIGVGDFDGDGRSDLIWRNNVTGVSSMWLMNDTQVRSTHSIGGDLTLRVVVTGDFNGDGRTDLVWRSSTTGVSTQWLMDGPSRLADRRLGGSTTLALLSASGTG